MESDYDDNYRLNVPITDEERRLSRDDSQDRLLRPSLSQEHDRHRPDSEVLPPEPVRFLDHHPFAIERRPVPAYRQPPQETSNNYRDPPENFHEPEDQLPKSKFGYAPVQRVPDFWRPLWLRTSVLASFVILFAGILTGLVLLRYYAKHHSGLGDASSSSHYTSTYLPTTVLVVILALWRPVDHQCKSLAPWSELRKGPTSASKSILVDYVSVFQGVALIEAFRNGHWAVVASTLAFSLLQLMTVFSTGLFVLLPMNVTDTQFPLIATSRFDSALFDNSTISGAPVYSYYGHLSQHLPFASGVANDFAYSTFRARDNAHSDANLTAQTSVFIPQPNCLVIDAQGDGPSVLRGDTDYGDLVIKLPDGAVCQKWADITVPAYDPSRWILPSRQLTGTMQTVSCAAAGEGPDTSKETTIHLYTLTDIKYQQTLFANATQFQGGNSVIASDVSRTISKMVNVACRPSYVVADAYVSEAPSVSATNSTATGLSILISSHNPKLPGVCFDAKPGVCFLGFFGISGAIVWNHRGAGSSRYDVLLQTHRMRAAAEAVYSGITSQYAHQSLRRASQEPTTGTAVYSKSRLQLQPVALWAMVAGFAMLIPLPLIVIFKGPHNVISRNPGSIASIAAILTRSNDLQWTLRNHGSSQRARLQAVLSEYKMHSAIIPTDTGDTDFKIVMEGNESGGNLPDPPSSSRMKHWRPWSHNLLFVVLAILLPIGGLVALELLQRKSDKHNGILSLPNSNSSTGYTHFVPAILVLLLAAIYNYIESTVSILAPYTSLDSGNASAYRTLTLSLIDKLPPYALFGAFRMRQLGAAFAIIAAMFASVLAILVSGLYSIYTSGTSSAVMAPNTTRPLSRVDTFRTSWRNSVSDDAGAAAMLDLMEHNPSQPFLPYTYGQYALPHYALSNGYSESASAVAASNQYTATMPAVHAKLSCTPIPRSSIDILYIPKNSSLSAYSTNVVQLTVNAPLPDSCHLGGTSGDASTVRFDHVFAVGNEATETYAGQMLDLLFGSGSDIYGHYGEFHSRYIGDSPNVGCPSLAFTFGKFANHASDDAAVTSVMCTQHLEVVKTQVTLEDPTNGIFSSLDVLEGDNSDRAMVPNPDATVEDGKFVFGWRIQQNLNTYLTPFTRANNTAFDGFFQVLFYDEHGVGDPSTLVGPANISSLLEHVQNVYGTYMALVLNNVMRQPCADNTTCSATSSNTPTSSQQRRQSSSVNDLGTLTVPLSTSRLVQSRGSKLAMQILFALMSIFAFLSHLATGRKVGQLVPHNVCTIAGVMALLGGSSLCESESIGRCECCGRTRRGYVRHNNASTAFGDQGSWATTHGKIGLIPHGAEWASLTSDKTLEKILDGRPGESGVPYRRIKYSMGWWKERPESGRVRRFGIDIGVRADGEDDVDWELGKRGSVMGKALGWADFMRRGGTDGSHESRGKFKQVRRLDFEDDNDSFDGDGMYMSGALGSSGSAIANDRTPAHVEGIELTPLSTKAQLAPVERFRSLRGYRHLPSGTTGRGRAGYAYAVPSEEDVDEEEDAEEAANDARHLMPGLHSRAQSVDYAARGAVGASGVGSYSAEFLHPAVAAAGTAERRVRWREEDEVRYLPRKSEDNASSLYSGDGYGFANDDDHDDGRGRRLEGRDGTRSGGYGDGRYGDSGTDAGSGMSAFHFGFGGRDEA